MRKRTAMRDMTVAALTFALSTGLAAAQEPTTHEAHEEHEHANEVAVFLGGTTESDTTHFTIGAEYERRLGERFGMSFVSEHVSGTGAWVFLAPFTLRPVRALGRSMPPKAARRALARPPSWPERASGGPWN